VCSAIPCLEKSSVFSTSVTMLGQPSGLFLHKALLVNALSAVIAKACLQAASSKPSAHLERDHGHGVGCATA